MSGAPIPDRRFDYRTPSNLLSSIVAGAIGLLFLAFPFAGWMSKGHFGYRVLGQYSVEMPLGFYFLFTVIGTVFLFAGAMRFAQYRNASIEISAGEIINRDFRGRARVQVSLSELARNSLVEVKGEQTPSFFMLATPKGTIRWSKHLGDYAELVRILENCAGSFKDE